MGSHRLLAIQVGAGHVAMARFSRIGTRLRLDAAVRQILPATASRESDWPGLIRRTVSELAGTRDFGSSGVLVPPTHLVLAHVVRLTAGAESELATTAREHIPIPLDEVVWQSALVARREAGVDVLLAAARAEPVQALCDAVVAAGVAIDDAIPGVWLLRSAIRHQRPEAIGPDVFMNVGARSTQLLLVGRDVFATRTLTFGGEVITEAIAGEVRTRPEDAERLKLGVCRGTAESDADSARALVERAIALFTRRLGFELQRTLGHWGSEHPGLRIAAIYLGGGASRTPGLADALAGKFGIPVGPFDPLDQVECAPDSGAEAFAPTDFPAELVGAAAAVLLSSEPVPSLLPPAARQTATSRRLRPRRFAAAVMTLLALLPPLGLLRQRTAAAEEQFAALARELMPLQAAAERNAERMQQLAGLRERASALRGALAARSSWIELLEGIQTVLGNVEDVWLDRMQWDPPPSVGIDGGHHAGRLRLAGKVLQPPAAGELRVGEEVVARLQRLRDQLRGLPGVGRVEGERFEPGPAGLLRFEVVVALKSALEP